MYITVEMFCMTTFFTPPHPPRSPPSTPILTTVTPASAMPDITLSCSIESPYEVMDAEEARKNARKAKERKEQAALRAAAAVVEIEHVLSEEEVIA